MSQHAPSHDVTGARRRDRSSLSLGLLISLLLNGLLAIILVTKGGTVSLDIESASTSSERLDRLESSIESMRIGLFNDIESMRIGLFDDIGSMRIGLFNDMVDRVVEGAADDQERSMRVAAHIARYMVNDYLDLGPPTSTDEISWWETRRGLCSARVSLMVTSLHRLNIQAQKWNIYDYGFAHNAVQAFYDGEWHYFDPTNAGCFLDEDGRVMSWDEIVAEPQAAYENMVVFETPLDLYSDGSRVDAEHRMRANYDPQRLARVRAAGPPWSRAFRIPVRLLTPVDDETSVRYGELDGDSNDMRSTGDVAKLTQCYYLDALGMYHDNFIHELDLENVTPGYRYRVTYHLIPPRRGPARLVASSSTGRIVEGAEGPVCSEAEVWSIVYEPGDMEEHQITVGLSSDEERSYCQVDAITVEAEEASAYDMSVRSGADSREAVGSEFGGGASETPKLDRLADQFSGAGASTLEQLKNLNAWIACSMGSDEKPIKSGEDALEIMEAFCGWRDIVFQEVGHRYGIRHRRVGFLNVPEILSHAASEFRVDDQWRFFDATYGRFFSLPDAPDTPVSLAELRRGWPDVIIRTVVLERYQGRWLPPQSFEYRRQRPSELSSAEADDLVQLYLLSDLVIHDPDEIYLDRLTVRLDRDEYYGTGLVDESSADMQSMSVETAAGPIYTPFLPFLGSYGSTGPIIVKVFELVSDDPGTAELRLHFVGDAPPIAAHLRHAVMRYGTADRRVEMESNGSTVTIRCPVYPPVTSLILRRLDCAITQLDAIEWRFTALSREAHAAPSEP